MKRSCLFLLLMLFTSGWLAAQQSVVISGGSATGIGGSNTYSVGQVAYTEISGASGVAIQGVQQPYEIYVLDIEEHPAIRIEAMVYPNPTLHSITLKIVSGRIQNFQYELFDALGRLMLQNYTTGIETSIPMENFPSASYILKVRSGKSIVKSFKIIKN